MKKDIYIASLIEKLNEWGREGEGEFCEIVIDVFTSALVTEGWEEDDILALLDGTADFFANGMVKDALEHEAMAIRSGY